MIGIKNMNKFLSLVIAAALMVSTTSAFGHAKMKSNVPEIGAEVEGPVGKLELNFSKSVRLMNVKLLAAESASEVEKNSNIPEDALVPLTSEFSKKFSKSKTVTFEPLAAGLWAYQWKAVAKDGHAMTGVGHFVIVE